MAGLRPGRCYRVLKRAYTRKSKYKKKGYIKAIPPTKIAKYDMGDLRKSFPCQVDLISKQTMQVRHNALESARVMIVRGIEKQNKPYHLKLRLYPHQALRENKMLTGAGADRMQTGMQKSFGKTIGTAARVKAGKTIFTIYVEKPDVNLASEVMDSAVARLPCRCRIKVTKKAK